MNNDFLLNSKGAVRLYSEAAKELPVIDFHNHVSVSDIKNDRAFNDIYELWLETDPYKHRLMRICGIEEEYITGKRTPYEKFEKFCWCFPLLAGNPVYDWSRMELFRVFDIDKIPSKDNAKLLWDEINERLSSKEFSARGILKRFNIEYQAPVASLTDDISEFNGDGVAPSLRGDNLLSPNKTLIDCLKEKTGVNVTDNSSYIKSVSVLLDRFNLLGCRIADHSLDYDFFENDKNGEKAKMLILLAKEYAKRGWMLLLHIGAKRDTSSRLAAVAGPAGGYAAVGECFPISKLCDLLNLMEKEDGLPNTVIFPLNMSDQAPLSVLQGSFSQDKIASKVQLGPAWWWCDHAFGIENTLNSIASFGVLSQFIGMTTDSRSLLSFVRHDYFRRLLCNSLDKRNNNWELSFDMLKNIVTKICYQNAKDKIMGGINNV